MKSRLSTLLQGDKVIWLLVTLLSIVSILTVYSSAEALAYRSGNSGGAGSFLIKHLILLFGSLLVMYTCHVVNYMRYARLAPILLLICIPLLLYTLLLGETINQATRWIRLPFIGITFQTSDFAKLALVVYTARTLSLMQSNKGSLGQLIVPVLLICVLIAPADLSSALILFFTCLLLMFIGRVEIRNVFSLLMLGIGLFSVLIISADYFPGIRVGTWETRLKAFMEGGGQQSGQEFFQVVQAKIAIAKGGFVGEGPGNGLQAHNLPHAYSDYIYCIIIEEYGMLGGMVVIILYMVLLIRCIRLVTRSPKAFGAMLALGLCLGIVIQAFAHMAVNLNLLPVTGLTLPMVSMGGTSLLFTAMSLGIILSVSRYIEMGSTN